MTTLLRGHQWRADIYFYSDTFLGIFSLHHVKDGRTLCSSDHGGPSLCPRGSRMWGRRGFANRWPPDELKGLDWEIKTGNQETVLPGVESPAWDGKLQGDRKWKRPDPRWAWRASSHAQRDGSELWEDSMQVALGRTERIWEHRWSSQLAEERTGETLLNSKTNESSIFEKWRF